MSLADRGRAELARQQAELVHALVGHAAPPLSFDVARLQAAARSLERKRQRELAHLWPGLVQELGTDFEHQFSRYASQAPRPEHGGPLADGRAFARFLAAQRQLGDAGRLEALRVDLHYFSSTNGLHQRRGFTARLLYLRRPRSVVLAVRLPWLGARWWRLPLGW